MSHHLRREIPSRRSRHPVARAYRALYGTRRRAAVVGFASLALMTGGSLLAASTLAHASSPATAAPAGGWYQSRPVSLAPMGAHNWCAADATVDALASAGVHISQVAAAQGIGTDALTGSRGDNQVRFDNSFRKAGLTDVRFSIWTAASAAQLGHELAGEVQQGFAPTVFVDMQYLPWYQGTPMAGGHDLTVLAVNSSRGLVRVWDSNPENDPTESHVISSAALFVATQPGGLSVGMERTR